MELKDIFSAADTGDLDRIRQLVEERADVNVKNAAGWTPLLYAANGGHGNENPYLEIARLLIEAGADINVQERTGWTPLHRAAHNKHPEMIKLLLENDASLTLRDSNGHTPEQFAEDAGRSDMAQILRDYPGEIVEMRALREKLFREYVENSTVLQQDTPCMKPLRLKLR